MEMRRVSLALSFAGLAGAGVVAAAQGPETPAPAAPKAVFLGAFKAVKFDVSPPLRSIPPIEVPQRLEDDRNDDPPSPREGALGPQDVDTRVQTRIGTGGEIPGPNVSFDGFSGTGPTPPDPNGDVGPNHYVAMANLRFAIYSKLGALLFGPVNNNTLWAGFGGPCETENAGDPVVVYDQMADRWVLTQFTDTAGPFFNCIAVSTTPDPTGSYFRYSFQTPTFPDYPKYGVWPDAYYVSTRESGAGQIGAYAIDRAAVLAGNPAALTIAFQVNVEGTPTGGNGLLPADMDGTTLPPAGSPNYFVGTMDQGGPLGAPQDALTLWKFHADFGSPGLSTFTLTNTIPVDPFDSIMPAPCSSTRECIPQPGTAVKIDHLGYRQRPTFRLAYRNFGTHESLVTNQSVEAPAAMAGIRWYEIRSPNSAPVVFQQGTYSPGATDGIFRWMGSIAMDRAGNMALGFSVSDGVSTFPGVRYTGRLSTDPLGQMPQGEGVLVNGTGSQTSSGHRWGDYTAMTVDNSDDCTFWYINEYYPVTSATAWRLRIGQFHFSSAECVPVPVDLQGFHIE
jgi:hypothetical protein